MLNYLKQGKLFIYTNVAIDSKCFSKFKPSNALLRRMNMGVHILSKDKNESETSLELCSFLLKYHRSIDYGDFSDSAYVV